MKTRLQIGKWAVLVTLAAALLIAAATQAAPDAAGVDWWVIGGGGGSAAGGGITLDGTIGQAVVGVNGSAPYELCSGFWCGTAVQYRIYLPLVLRNF